MNKRFRSILAILLLVFFVPTMVLGAANKPTTTSDPEVPVDELELKLKPLMRAEVKIEVDGWLRLLQEKVAEISVADIAVKYKGNETSKAEKLQAAFDALKKVKLSNTESLSSEDLDAKIAQAENTLEIAKEEARDALSRANESPEVETVTEKSALWFKEQETEKSQVLENNAVEKSKNDEPPGKQESRQAEKINKAIEQRERDRIVLLEFLTYLRAQQTALVDRVNAVIKIYEQKGGVAEELVEYRQYIQSVSGITVDVSDALATWKTISGWLMSEEGGLRWLKNIIVFIVIVMISIFLGRMAGKAIDKIMSRSSQTSRLLREFLVVTSRRMVMAVGVLIGLAALEINVGPLLAVIGAAGFVIAFSLQDSLGNFASGILIMVFKPFDVGDLVEIDGVLGNVKTMNLLSVLLYTLDNKSVIIPNNRVWGGPITNVNRTSTRRVDLEFGISYEDNIETAQQILEQLVSEHPLVLKDPEPLIRVHALADSSVNFICRPWVNTENYWDVYWDLTRTVKERFDKEGVSIPYPQQDVHYYSASSDSENITNSNALVPATAKVSKKSAQTKTAGSKHGMDSELSEDAS